MSKISELSDGGSLLPTDFLIAVRSGGNVKVQADQTEFDRIRLGDGEKIELGNNQDMQLFHDGSHSYIKDAGTGNLVLQGSNLTMEAADGTNYIAADDGGSVFIYHPDATNQVKLSTTAAGISVTGTVTAGAVEVDDTDDIRLRFSNASTFKAGLQVATTAGDMIATSTVDDLAIRSQSDILFATGGNTQRMKIVDTGIDVTGSVTADGLTVSNADGSIVKLESTGTGLGAGAVLGDLQFYGNDASTPGAGIKASITATTVAALGDDSQLMFSTSDGTTNNINRMLIANNGDLSLYEDTGTTAKLFWDASAESLGIGTSSPAALVDLKDTTPTLRLTDDRNISWTGNETLGNIEFFSSDASGDGTHVTGFIKNIQDRTGGSTQVTGALSFGVADYGVAAVEALRIDSLGNVGIGTSSPAAPMSVMADTSADVPVAGAASSHLAVGKNDQYGTMIGTLGSGAGYIQQQRFDGTGTKYALHIQPNNGTVTIGSTAKSTSQFDATLSVRDPGAAIEFGHNNQAGYGSTIGALANNGFPFIAFYSEPATTTSNAFRTRGLKGAVLSATTSGDMTFSRVPLATADDQVPVESMRIDASGHLLVGATSESTWESAAGFRARNSGSTTITRDGNPPLYVNRLNSDGTLLQLQKGTSVVGSIGTVGNHPYIGGDGTNATFLRFWTGTGPSVRPSTAAGANADAVTDLGASSARFKDLHLSGQAYASYFRPTAGSNDFINFSSGAIRFATGGSESARIDSGNLLVCTTSNYSVSKMTLDFDSVSKFGLTLRDSGSSGTAAMLHFVKGGNVVGVINSTTTATSYSTSSDQRLKENIVDAPSASDDIDAIQVRSFDWKADGQHQDYGMIAQELIEVAPEAVSAPEDPDEMMGVDYSKLVPMLVKEIQQLRQRVAQLEE